MQAQIIYLKKNRLDVETDNFIQDEIFPSDQDSYVLAIQPDGKCHFLYNVSEDCSFGFSLLCEVGEMWQRGFEELLTENNLKLDIVETPEDYYNIAIPKIQEAKQ